MTHWLSWFLQVAFWVCIVGFAASYFREEYLRRKPTRQLRVTLTGPTYARTFFAYSVGLDHGGRAHLLFGTSDNLADVYLVELQAGETVSWFTHDAELLGLTVGTVEVVAA